MAVQNVNTSQTSLIKVTQNKTNQISFGLIQTPQHEMITYLLDPACVESNTIAKCPNQNDPNYLPLVGLRVRKFGEIYPYNAIQGYRTGRNVEMRTYMQNIKDKPLPPPVRVIDYLHAKLACASIQGNAYIFGFPGLIGSGDFYAGHALNNVPSGTHVHLTSSTITGISTSFAAPNAPFYDNHMRLSSADYNMDPVFLCINAAGDVFNCAFLDKDIFDAHAKNGVDVLETVHFDHANDKIDFEICVNNVSGITLTDVSVSLTTKCYPDQNTQIPAPESSHVKNTKGYLAIPPERIITSEGLQTSYITALYMPDQGYTYITREGMDYQDFKFSHPDYIFNTADDPGIEAGISIAANLGDLAPDETKIINFSILFGNPTLYSGYS